jgi:hypothetical protein
LWLSKEGKVMVSASIDLPAKFENLIKREEERHQRLSNKGEHEFQNSL